MAILALLLAGLLGAAPASADPWPTDSRIDALVNKQVAGSGPGLALLVLRDGRVAHARGYGIADLRSRERIAPETLFNLASDSKQFTAMAIAMLEERGLLRASDPASRYLDLPAYARGVRVHHLIHHTSGLPDYLYEALPGRFPAWYPEELRSALCHRREPVTNEDVLRLLRRPGMGLEFAPGARYEYSNTGYVLLALIVERVSGLRFPEFLRREIFEPLGMDRTFVNELAVPRARGMALSYAYGGGRYHGFGPNSCEKVYGDGGIFSSVADLAKWAQALSGRGPRALLGPEAMARLFRPVRDLAGRSVEYGYGWRTSPEPLPGLPRLREPLRWHDGGWLGYENSVAWFPERDTWVLALSNSSRLSGAIDRLVRRVAGIGFSIQD